MPDPLPRDEHGHAAVELQLDHLAGRGVLVAAQVAQEAARRALLARAVAVADARRALDVLVGAEVVDQRDEAVVQNREVKAEDLFGRRAGRSLGLRHGVDVNILAALQPRSASSKLRGWAEDAGAARLLRWTMTERFPLAYIFPLRILCGVILLLEGWGKLQGDWLHGTPLATSLGNWLAADKPYGFFVPMVRPPTRTPRSSDRWSRSASCAIGLSLLLGVLTRIGRRAGRADAVLVRARQRDRGWRRRGTRS